MTLRHLFWVFQRLRGSLCTCYTYLGTRLRQQIDQILANREVAHRWVLLPAVKRPALDVARLPRTPNVLHHPIYYDKIGSIPQDDRGQLVVFDRTTILVLCFWNQTWPSLRLLPAKGEKNVSKIEIEM